MKDFGRRRLPSDLENNNSMEQKKKPILRLLTTLLLLLSTALSWAQRERNYIYILDCSNSMVTTYGIFEPTLDYLQKDIARLPDNTTVTVVPFQGNVYTKSVRHCQKKDFDWNKFVKEVTPYTEQLTGTNICAAWDYSLNYIDPNKDNYIYLLTDGKDNRNPKPDGTEAVCKRIRDWCGRYAHSQGYYVALSDEAMDQRIRQAVSECANFQLSSGIEKPIASFLTTEMHYNTLDPHDVTLLVSTMGQFPAVVTGDSTIRVSLVDGAIKDGRAKFHFEPQGDMSGLPDAFTVNVSIASDELAILNPELTLYVKNIPERSLLLPTEEIDLGEAEWYDSFWWKDAKQMDTLRIDLNPQYNASARDMAAHVELLFTETTTDREGRPTGLQSALLFNGQPCTDGRISLDPGKPAVLSLIPRTDSQEGKHYYQLIPVSNSQHNLETINQQPVSDYQLTLRSEYDVDMNPLKLAVIIISVTLIVLLLVWLLLLKRMFFPVIRANSLQVECEPIFKTVRIKGCRQVVFSNRRKEQNALARLFTGEIKYVREDFWDSEWSITPGTKKTRVRAQGISGYSMNPPGNTIEMQQPVDMKSLATGRKIRITLK